MSKIKELQAMPSRQAQRGQKCRGKSDGNISLDRAMSAVEPGAQRHAPSACALQVSAPNATSLWVIAGLAMAPAAAIGLARFAYALLLPSMRADLGWSYSDAGAINTANAAGYLAGALAAASFAGHFGVKRAFIVCIFVTAVMIGADGLTADFGTMIIVRFAAGAAGAIAFVSGGSLAAAAANGSGPARASIVLGIYFAGPGIGVVLSALAVPSLLDVVGWKGAWLILGLMGLMASFIAAPASARAPDPVLALPRSKPTHSWPARFMTLELIAYTLFGAGYIAYATFIIAYLKAVLGFGPTEVSIFWLLLGMAAIAAAFVWAPLLPLLKGGRGAAATLAVVTAGAALPLLSAGRPAAYLSALLFGGSFLAVIVAVTAFVRRAAPPHQWTAAIGALTAAFGAGQCIGPVLSGALSDGPNGVRTGLWLSVGILASAAVVAIFQPEPRGNNGLAELQK